MVNRYLNLISLEQALSILKTSFQAPTRTEKIPITQAVGRVVPLRSMRNIPFRK